MLKLPTHSGFHDLFLKSCIADHHASLLLLKKKMLSNCEKKNVILVQYFLKTNSDIHQFVIKSIN